MFETTGDYYMKRGGGGDFYMERSGMLVVPGTNQGFWSYGVDDEITTFNCQSIL